MSGFSPETCDALITAVATAIGTNNAIAIMEELAPGSFERLQAEIDAEAGTDTPKDES